MWQGYKRIYKSCFRFNMKNIKLAVIRGSHSEVCPFGLDIPNGCKNAGASIKDMLPTNDKMTDEEFQKTVDENIKVFNEKHDKTTCEHLTSILDTDAE